MITLISNLKNIDFYFFKLIGRYFTKYYFPHPKGIKINKEESLSKFYAQKILASKLGVHNKITDRIRLFSKEKKIDLNIILSIYYIENFYRPGWFSILEYKMFKIGLIKNPSIGPFQIRSGHLKNKGKKKLIEDSLNYIYGVIVRCGLKKNIKRKNFLKLGLFYNLDETYGEVIYNIWLKLTHSPNYV